MGLLLIRFLQESVIKPLNIARALNEGVGCLLHWREFVIAETQGPDQRFAIKLQPQHLHSSERIHCL